MNTKYIYFSIFGGNIFEVDIAEESIIDSFQIPLKAAPKKSCKKCHGSFYTGYDTVKRHYIMCSQCSRKCIDIDKILSKRKAHTTTK